MKKKIFSAFMAAMMGVSVFAIPVAAETEEAKLIGIEIGVPELPFFAEVEGGIKDACEERGWEYLAMYGTGDKVLEAGRTFMAQDVDAIVNFGVTLEAGTTLYEEATEKDIPVIDIDVKCGGYYFGANNQQAGQVAGEALGKIMNDRGMLDKDMKMVMFWGGQEGPDTRLRLTGIADGVINAGGGLSADNNYENDTILWQNVDDESKVKEYAKNQISALKDSTDIIIFSGVAEAYGPAFVAAAEETNMTDRVFIATHNESAVFLKNLEDPDTPWVVSTAYMPDQYGKYIGEMLDTIFAGEELGEETLMEHVAITAENKDDFQVAY